MKNIKLSIKYRIFGGFIFMVLAFIIVATISYYNALQNDAIVQDASENKRPSSKAINDMKHMVTRSKMLITNWVYLQGNNDADKESLKNLIDIEYPALKEDISMLRENWDDSSLVQSIDTVVATFEKMIEVQQGIMSQLVSFEDYEDPFTKLMAEDAVTTEVLPLTTFMNEQLLVAETIQDGITAAAERDQIDASTNMKTTNVVAGIIMVIFALSIAYYMGMSITNPINYIKDLVVKMGSGELPEDQDKKFNNDEIGEMAKAMDNLIVGLKSTTLFAENIGKGNYDSEFKPLSDNDVLGNALIEMRTNLKRVADEDKKRSWATEGQARFGEILRSNNSDIDKLSDEIVRNMVKYLNANQGGLFVIDNTDEDNHFMELQACYAWDKKKYLEQKVYKGDGLSGQCWQEKEKIYITDVPQDYVNITSGLGDANPTSILIVPLKVNDEIYGVLELASFKLFEDHEIEFVEKIAESIASTISTVRVNAKTQNLLEESQQMTEEMRAQEEEMRQNMEELQATQEEMHRDSTATKGFIDAVNVSIATIEFNPKGDIQTANDNFLKLTEYNLEEIQGKHHSIFVAKQERSSAEYQKFWEDLGNGVIKDGEFERYTKSGKKIIIHGNYSPIRDANGEVKKILKLAYDITNYVGELQIAKEA